MGRAPDGGSWHGRCRERLHRLPAARRPTRDAHREELSAYRPRVERIPEPAAASHRARSGQRPNKKEISPNLASGCTGDHLVTAGSRPADRPCSSPAGGVTLTGFSKRLKAWASRRSYRCDRTESRPRPVIWPATSHAAWPSDASPIARAAFGFDTAAPASQSPHAAGSGAAVFRHPPNDSGPLAGPQMLSAGAQDTIRQNAPRMGAFDHWSRKLRSLREREGCFSLRSAFASI